MTSCHLTSRQSNALADAFLKAKDEDGQRDILAHPEQVIDRIEQVSGEDIYDTRLSGYGNELMLSICEALSGLEHLLTLLEDERMCKLQESETVIIIPFLRKTAGYLRELTGKMGHS